MVAPVQPPVQIFVIECCARVPSKKDDVESGAATIVSPDRSTGKCSEECCKLAFYDVRATLVQGYPLRHDSARGEVPPNEFEIFLCVERCGTLHPRMNGIGRDDIEFFFRRKEKVPRVVVDDLYARIFEDVVVLLGKIFPNNLWYERLDFTDNDSLNCRVHDEASSRDPCAKADNQYGTRPLVQQGGKMAKH